MYELKYSNKIKRDMRTCKKRGYDFEEFEKVIDKLRIPEPLEDKNREHNLTGDYTGFKECHVAPNWLLIYRYCGEYLELARTGTHSDLFK